MFETLLIVKKPPYVRFLVSMTVLAEHVRF